MFQAGEYVVYSSLGVCEVLGITASSLRPEEEQKQYYRLVPVNGSGEIMVPVDTPVFIRRILSGDEANDLIDSIPAMQVQPFHARGLQELKQHYNQALSSRDPAELLRLILSIRMKKQERLRQNQRIGIIDENCQKRAMNLLYGEFSLSLGIPFGDVDEYVLTRAGLE